jgi:hypothetical protein
MRIPLSLSVVLALLSGTNACADPSSMPALNIERSPISHHRHDPSTGHTYVLKDSSVLVAREGVGGATVTATLFFSGAIDKDALVNKMLWILVATDAPAGFRDWAANNLARNRRFEQDSFVMPLKSEKFGTHEFTYTNTGHNQLYILGYRRLASAP